MKLAYLLILTAFCVSCGEKKAIEEKAIVEESVATGRPVSADDGKFFDQNNTRMLYGGEDSTTHFDISNLTLKEAQFHYGIGREAFPALLAPEFITLAAADSIWSDTTRFLVGSYNGETKAYSVPDLTRHEVVNDSLGGLPIMAAYCILADLGAIYNRNYGDRLLTFGLSGYTYFDPEVWEGLDGFVLWDRETESLWWPLTGKAVSGPLEGVRLQEMDEQYWEDLKWTDVKEKYPDVVVLASGQDFERPTHWAKYDDVVSIVQQFSK
ncbi:MAG: DUF3179 domain-containing (seleno)protein [Reichenbachiella sp.]|uniref:DUF3179 domain-containing (seleno)protein n=1 Tax=Reichenbachiella sp. TaxID=2184521 RepID=UPI0032662E52